MSSIKEAAPADDIGFAPESVLRLDRRAVWRHPMDLQPNRMTRLIVRSVLMFGRSRILEVRGLSHVAPANDPFIFVANHNQRLEAVVVPAILLHSRRGKIVHFMADWPTMMVPLAGMMLRHGEVIPITSKNARWPVLNRFKRFYKRQEPAFDQAANKLRAGASIGVFPEATMNRHPDLLLRGQTGAARLALRTGVPVVPAGIRFPTRKPDQAIGDRTPMALEIGPAIHPPEVSRSQIPKREDVKKFHARMMQEIARLSGKSWHPQAKRRRNDVPDRATHGT